MHFQHAKALYFLFSCLLMISNNSKAQKQKDTIYFDENWSICEKPVAEYYRICTLNREQMVFYKGDVEDYFMDGSLEMKGHYDAKGLKDGIFLFYRANGKVIKNGNFLNDKMYGLWSYYDSEGNVKVQFNCNGSTDLTPILILNNSGDTILKNGNGKFVFDSQKDLPEIFPPACVYTVEGEVINYKKEGTFSYVSIFGKQNFKRIEIYKNGEFKKGKDDSYAGGIVSVNQPFTFLNLSDPNLDKIDNFDHSNMVFGFGEKGDKKVINFLLNAETPLIQSEAASFENNAKDIFEIVGKVMRKHLSIPQSKDINYSYSPSYIKSTLLSFVKPATINTSPQNVRGTITVTIDTSGFAVNSIFKGNFSSSQIGEINYYLSRLSNLASFKQENEKAFSNINIQLLTFVDTLKNETEASLIRYTYTAENTDVSDTAKKSVRGQYNNLPFTVQIQAKFPGGPYAWQKYLERNLRSNVPSDKHAPDGNYTVFVSFMVDESGNISDVKAENNPGYGTADEAVRVIKAGPQWTPAVNEGKNVAYRQKQSITFQVSGR